MSPTSRAAPRLRAVVRRAAGALRHPDHRRRRHPRQGPGDLRLRRRERPGGATRSGTDTKIEGGRGATGDRHAIMVDKSTCRLYETCATHQARPRPGHAGSGATWSLKQQHAAARGLDVGRRSRAADPARAAALGRGQGRPRRPRDPVHHRRHRPRATSGRPGTRPGRSATTSYPPMGARFRLKASYSRLGLPADSPGGAPGDEDVRAGARRQRLAVVLPGHLRRRAGRSGCSTSSSASRRPRSRRSTPPRSR